MRTLINLDPVIVLCVCVLAHGLVSRIPLTRSVYYVALVIWAIAIVLTTSMLFAVARS